MNAKQSMMMLVCLVWLCLFAAVSLPQLARDLSQGARLGATAGIEEKKLFLWDGFYRFLAFCRGRIPEDARVYLHNDRSRYERTLGPAAGFSAWEWHRQQAGYELYPRRIFTRAPAEAAGCEYVIVIGGAASYSGFSRYAEDGNGNLILKREEGR